MHTGHGRKIRVPGWGTTFILSYVVLPLIQNFQIGGSQIPGIRISIFVKSAHTCKLFTKNSWHTFGFETFCFFCEGGILVLLKYWWEY